MISCVCVCVCSHARLCLPRKPNDLSSMSETYVKKPDLLASSVVPAQLQDEKQTGELPSGLWASSSGKRHMAETTGTLPQQGRRREWIPPKHTQYCLLF